MTLNKDFLPTPSLARPGIPLRNPTSITIHWIGPYPHQSVYSPYYWWRDGTNGQGRDASAHFIVKDANVLQAIPIEEVAYHAGPEANYTSIGIEVIPSNTLGVFSELTVKTLKELLATLPRLPLKRHYDWTGKDCPRYYIPEENWTELKERLRG